MPLYVKFFYLKDNRHVCEQINESLSISQCDYFSCLILNFTNYILYCKKMVLCKSKIKLYVVHFKIVFSLGEVTKVKDNVQILKIPNQSRQTKRSIHMETFLVTILLRNNRNLTLFSSDIILCVNIFSKTWKRQI
jgi:hypothetical protein